MAERTSSARGEKSFFNLLQWSVRALLLPIGGTALAAGKLTYLCIRDNLTKALPFSLGMTIVSFAGLVIAMYGGFYIELEYKPDKPRNKFQLTVGSMTAFFLIFCVIVTLYISSYYNEKWTDYVISVMAGLIGVYWAFNINNIIGSIRQRDRRDRLLRDIHFELKDNSALLVGRGYILMTVIWDSAVSAALIQQLDSKILMALSKIYHHIELNIYEAKICRQAGESFSGLSEGSSEREALHQNWRRLSRNLKRREPELKKEIDDLLEEDLWKRAGVKENAV